jgi:hypothetical protein
MKNYLIAINNELKDYYDKFTTNIDNFEQQVDNLLDNLTALVDYYIEPIFKSGQNVIRKQLGLKSVNEINDVNILNDYKFNQLEQLKQIIKQGLIDYYNVNNKEKIYNDMFEIVFSFLIKLFRHAQLLECKLNEIENVYLLSDPNYSCPYCQTLSQFKQSVNGLIEQIDTLHSLCKLIIFVDSVSNLTNIAIDDINFVDLPKNFELKIKPLITNLKLSCPHLITNKTFKFVANIVNQQELMDVLTNKFDASKVKEILENIDDKITYLDIDDIVLVSMHYLNDMNYIITKLLLVNKLSEFDLTWWSDRYYDKQKYKYVSDGAAIQLKPFVNYMAEQSDKSYFIESAVYYITNPTLLKQIDEEAYDKLKEDIYNNIEFLRR